MIPVFPIRSVNKNRPDVNVSRVYLQPGFGQMRQIKWSQVEPGGASSMWLKLPLSGQVCVSDQAHWAGGPDQGIDFSPEMF